MKKLLLIIPALCLMFLLMQGSKQSTDFTYIKDSLKSTTDTTDTWSIQTSYGKLFKHQYISLKDTGATYADSVRVYGTDDAGNKFLCQLENLSSASVVKTNIMAGANATTYYKIMPEFLKEIEIVRNGNAIYTANSRVDYTITLVNE